MNLKVYRLRPDAKLPTRAHQSDAGVDIYYCPKGTRARIIREEGFAIEPRQSVLMPTGLKAEIPYGYMMEIKNKSGIAFKRQLVVGACVIDPGYDGEIYVNLHNLGLKTQYLRPGDKIAQAVMVPIIHCSIQEVETDKILNLHSPRGEGGFGSTGNR
tara:strand:- start:677 stop:1147 length:471 start_codon:yes stop_codon:yes gene_type:complete